MAAGQPTFVNKFFSVMNINKAQLSSRLTHKLLDNILRSAASQDMTPDIDALVQTKKCQVSCAKSKEV